VSGLAVVAFGGNALVRDAEHASIHDQRQTVTAVAPQIVDLVEAGWRLVITHGNGPQVGFILRRSELAIGEVTPVPVDYAVGDTQGAIGYMFAQAIGNELHHRSIDKRVVALVSQTVVGADDPAFRNPEKPIGAFMDEATAQRRAESLGWTITEDAGRGWRRTVASPSPLEIVELPVVRSLCEQGVIVVAVGGGGIPVIRDASDGLVGVEAVVDKDRTSALLAIELDADLLIIPTAVDRVAVDFGSPDQRWLDTLSVGEAAELAAQGQFGEGSMGPKIEALVDFVQRRPGGAGIITSPHRLHDALLRRNGTWIEA